MREFDAALKQALMQKGSRWFRLLTGCKSLRWLNVELQKSRSLRADLLGVAPDRRIFHFELQSGNDPAIWLRMLEYAVAIHRKYGRWPEQFVIYVGSAPLQMKNLAEETGLSFRFPVVDIRSVDTEPLLASPCLGDNVIAILTRMGEDRETVRRVLDRIANGPKSGRSAALGELLVIAGLRQMGEIIESEAEQMPLLNDIMDHELFGPRLRAARQEGLKEGIHEGMQQGMQRGWHKGEMSLFLRLVEHRFGALRPALRRRIEALTAEELQTAGVRLLDAARIEDLFPR